MNFSKSLLVVWIITMLIVTFCCSLVFVVTQHTLRLGANDEPLQLANDTMLKIQDGQNVQNAVISNNVDISKSLGTFVMVFDNNQNMIASSVTNNDGIPSYPKGVLDYVSKNGEDRVTWQPETGLRFATVAIKDDNEYVVAGKSLSFTESLIDSTGNIILMAWAFCLIISAIAVGIIYFFLRKFKFGKNNSLPQT